jgi:hypothetical protein
MYLFRIHIRPGGGSSDMKETFEYCLRNGLLGVGWRTEENKNTTDWDEYLIESSKIHDNLNVCKYIKKWVNMNDLVWTRDASGQYYYLARVISGWEYWMNQEAIERDIDIANIFRVEFQKVNIDQVPGKVIACFRAPRTIQEIADEKAIEYSKYLWNTVSGEKVYKIDNSKFSDVFMMLDDEETEDLVFLYLQSKGWYVVPNSRKADTMRFEYLALDSKTGERAFTQVKTGNVHLNKEEYSRDPYKIFLFQSNELYDGKDSENVCCITKHELNDFLQQSIEWLPDVFKCKSEMVNK